MCVFVLRSICLHHADISPDAVYYANGFGRWIDLLKLFMDRKFQLTCRTPGINYRLVKFPITYNGVSLDVDLLASPYWNTPREFYDFLRRIPKEKRAMLVTIDHI